MSLTIAHLERSWILCQTVARQEYLKYGYIEFMGKRVYKDSLSESITDETKFRDSVGFGDKDRYSVVTVFMRRKRTLVGSDISSIQTYWIGKSKDFVPTLTNPHPLDKHRRHLITLEDGSVIRVREISKEKKLKESD